MPFSDPKWEDAKLVERQKKKKWGKKWNLIDHRDQKLDF